MYGTSDKEPITRIYIYNYINYIYNYNNYIYKMHHLYIYIYIYNSNLCYFFLPLLVPSGTRAYRKKDPEKISTRSAYLWKKKKK